MPSTEQRDLRRLLRHRHQWVRMRIRVQRTLQSMALNQGLRRGHSQWNQAGQQALRALRPAPHASERSKALMTLYPRLQIYRRTVGRSASKPKTILRRGSPNTYTNFLVFRRESTMTRPTQPLKHWTGSNSNLCIHDMGSWSITNRRPRKSKRRRPRLLSPSYLRELTCFETAVGQDPLTVFGRYVLHRLISCQELILLALENVCRRL